MPQQESTQDYQEIMNRLDKQEKTLASIKRSIKLSAIFSFIRLLFIVIPLILAIIYLLPFVQEAQNLLNSPFNQPSSDSGFEVPDGFDINEFREFIERSR